MPYAFLDFWAINPKAMNHLSRTQKLVHRIKYSFVALVPWMIAFTAHAQVNKSIGIMNMAATGVIPESSTLGGMVRIEMEKTGRYEVMDWHDMQDVLTRNNMHVTSCFGKTCAVEAGKILGVDKMLIGSVERFGERIAITLKIIDVPTEQIELSNTSEYANLQNELQRMIEISVKGALGMEVDQKLADQLKAYDQPIASTVGKVNLSGPRMGLYYTTGIIGERMRGESNGGFDMYQVTSMIGWQQEVQYLSSGNFQCLLEFLLTGSGLESGRFIPSFTFLNGFRMNKQGWEVALGPTFRVARVAKGYYDLHGENNEFHPVNDWHLESEYNAFAEEYASGARRRSPSMKNLDERGNPEFSAGLVFAVGKTFRSGQLNIPLNVYIIPRKDGTVYGMSIGFNVFKSEK